MARAGTTTTVVMTVDETDPLPCGHIAEFCYISNTVYKAV